MKQTEIGLIPDDWEVKNFKEVTNRITVGIANSATHAYTDHGIIMFRNQNIKENILDLKDLIYIKKDFAQRYSNKQLYENDLLIARTGYPGTTCVVPKEFEGCQTFTTLIASPKSDVINSDYIAYYFNSDFGKKLFSAAQIGGAQKNVNAHTLSNIKICIPPLAEQQRIAKALSDVDALISTTEKLIQKKKNIKQGTMQNLLTGKKRLPGFGPQTKTPTYKQTELGAIPEDWEVKTFGDYVYIVRGGSPRPIQNFLTTNSDGIN
ncbi:restriction endonuclease subunit S, partial [uncultured Treponema sp.]|uniref:restriction endonuclease subunit S n=1 Tax=uncultured Treponema sp. TaxID=162155 RepID=UPI0025ED2019